MLRLALWSTLLSSVPAASTECPAHVPRPCVVVPEQQLRSQAVYAPSLPPEALASALITDSISPLEVSVWVCVDPRGRVSHAYRSGPGPSQVLVQRLTETLLRWRVVPVRRDDAPIHTCAQVSFSIPFGPEPAPREPERHPSFELPISSPLPYRQAYLIHAPWHELRDAPLDWGRLMRWRGRQRTGELRVCIDANGRPTKVRTTRKITPKLDEALRELVERWRFMPMLVDDVPHESCVRLRLRVLFTR